AVVHDNNVVNGTFLINNVYASVLFDTGADRIFVSSTFNKYINVTATTLDTNFGVELADGKSLDTNTILRGCTLNLQKHLFNFDLLPIKIGSFNIIIEMDWMSFVSSTFSALLDVIPSTLDVRYDVELADGRVVETILYLEMVRIPYGDEILIVQGDRSGEGKKLKLSIILCTKT
nr:hypothetical protein [Tanacetum cinerariifolium]